MTGSFDSSALSSESQPSNPTSAPPSPLFAPLPGPQTKAFESEATIIGYGGAAGGGKSLLELGLAVTKHRKSIVFRRHKEDVKDLWSKLRMLCGTHGRPNESSKEWRDLPGDRYVRLVGLQHLWDWMKYQGQEHDLWCFDEATQFPELPIRTLMAWCRSTDPAQLCQVVLGFNPPTTPEGEWIIDFFAPWLSDEHPNPAEPGELRWFARLDDKDVEVEDGSPFEHNGELIRPLSRTFFPARLADNPILDATNYRSMLQGMPEPLRSQMLYGDFTIGLEDEPWQVIPRAWVQAAQKRWTEQPPEGPVDQVGIDVAQGGSDNTVSVQRRGAWFSRPVVVKGKDVPDAGANAAEVTRIMADGGVGWIDADGIGSATFFLAKATLKQGIRAYQGSAPTEWRDKARVLSFVNTRAAAWWALREALDPSSGVKIALPPDRELRVELCAPRWEKLTHGVKIEKKDEVHARIGRSPDLADAVVMAWWDATRSLAAAFERSSAQAAPPPTPQQQLRRAAINSREYVGEQPEPPQRSRLAAGWG